VQRDQTTRSAVNCTPPVTVSVVLEEFVVDRSSGSSWTQKTVERRLQGLSIDVFTNKIRFKTNELNSAEEFDANGSEKVPPIDHVTNIGDL
jgi:hypothetical protein